MKQDLGAELDAIRNHCGVANLSDRSLLHINGADSTRWLNGMVTNSMAALGPGEGAYTFVLSAQGRIQGDATVYREPGISEPVSFLLSTTAAQMDVLQPWLERYIIMDDVELTRIGETETSLVLLGPESENVLQNVGLPFPAPLRFVLADTADGPVQLFTPAPCGSHLTVPQVELRASAAVVQTLHTRLRDAGATDVSPDALEAERVLEGTPLFGTDIRDRDLPQETGQTHALHFAKGCYLGQEIVERIRSRGQVHRVFTRLQLSGELPSSLPAMLIADGKPAGEITSAAAVPAAEGTSIVALGYLRREALSGSAVLTYDGGTAAPRTASA